MKINIEEILELQDRRAKINNALLSEIEFYENGIKIEIDPEVLEEWKFIGLNNTDFIIMDAYKNKTTIFESMA